MRSLLRFKIIRPRSDNLIKETLLLIQATLECWRIDRLLPDKVKIFMITRHQIYFQDSGHMEALPSNSVDLVVTSPPYPMIEMWDSMFTGQDAEIAIALQKGDGLTAFEKMHRVLDTVWHEVWRILKTGGTACINVGDAARTINRRFMLYPNHSRILSQFLKLGFHALPVILWRKQTNAPNKFMGSGMLPPSAYVTLEHEYILILRKGAKREFKLDAEKQNRRESAFFWEERNAWFSDVWMDVKGTSQNLGNRATRLRSAAFPFEVSYRLINMFSVKGDTVVDPFLGIGTTMWAAMTAGRNCIGYEIERGLRDEIDVIKHTILPFANEKIKNRIRNHLGYLDANIDSKGGFNYRNAYYNFPVKTSQETEIFLNPLMTIETIAKNSFEVTYSDKPHHLRVIDKHKHKNPQTTSSSPQKTKPSKKMRRSFQRALW
jgi:DNA modification methylase